MNDAAAPTFSQQFKLSDSVVSGRLFCLEKPLQFAEGTVGTKPSTNSVSTTQYYTYDLLIHASDLYAINIKTDMGATLITNTLLRDDVELASSRPAVVQVDEFTDMLNWDPLPADQVTTTTDGDRCTAEVTYNGARKFLQSSATAIVQNDR